MAASGITLKEVPAADIPTPNAGKDTIFFDDDGVAKYKNDAGAVNTFPSVGSFNGRTGAIAPLQADYDSFFTTPGEAAAAAPVQTVFGRSGTVTALQSDYDSFFLTPTEGNASYTPLGRTLSTTAPLTGGGDLSANRTFAIVAATTAAAGSMSGPDKLKLNNIWYDVTNYGFVGDDATDNAGAWAAFFAALPVGAQVYWPPGTYRTSNEFNINADKHLRNVGGGRYASIIKITNNTQNAFRISGNFWYNSFSDLGFLHSGTPTGGAGINIDPGASGSAVGTNIQRVWCNGLFTGIRAVGQQAANLSVWNDLDISSAVANSRGLILNGEVINLVIHSSFINLGPGSGAATNSACCEINWSGAVQLFGCDFIGGTNTLLLNANQGGSSSIAAVYATNTFLDQSGGSTLKIMGANVTNRVKFTQCGITGGNVAGAAAIEIASTGTGAAGTATARADGVNFVDCDIYPNGGSGTTHGALITGAQGVAFNGSRISGWTNGIQFTPSVSNGYSKIDIVNCKKGATNNFTTPNTVGVLLNAGSFQFGSINIANNDFTGSTTPLVDTSTTAFYWQKSIKDNIGIVSPGKVALPMATTAIGASATVLINGTSIPLPTNGQRIGSRFLFNVNMVKTAAGTSTWQAHVKYGVNNTTADAAIASWTSGTNTAAIDQCQLEIEVEILTLGGAATARCFARYVNTLTNATGFGVIQANPTGTAAFNSGATSPFLHIDIQSGALAAYTAIGSGEVTA